MRSSPRGPHHQRLSGEGKTTLATQLAMSLVRARRRTVLVDFDLRQPTLDGALGLPLGPGICEALRGEGDIMGMVQQTETECLSVVTAGAWNRQVLPALSNGTVGTVLEQLRANFDFVIIDSSPLLPIVDTRLVCQHVDAVVLSVFRDISQGSDGPGGPGDARRLRRPQRGSRGDRRQGARQREEPGLPVGGVRRARPGGAPLADSEIAGRPAPTSGDPPSAPTVE